MELLETLKSWIDIIQLLLIGVFGWLIKANYDKIKARESAEQEVQHTAQEKIATEEKDFELDSRRVKVSEEVASETLEHLAETREENLKLLEDNYEQRKAIVDLQFEMRLLKKEVAYIREEKSVLCYFFCRKGVTCAKKEPVFGPFQLDRQTLEELKQMIANDQEIGPSRDRQAY